MVIMSREGDDIAKVSIYNYYIYSFLLVVGYLKNELVYDK
jgi:hypothetical protein